jgi:PEP-CTERM motif-containing protein
MERSFKQYLLAGTMLAGGVAFGGGVTPAAAAVCPAVGADSDCALIIDITSVSGGVGTFTVSKGPSFAQGPYDGVEDTLLGVTNSSGQTVTSIHLVSKLDIGGFDGDGLQAYNGRPTKGLPSGGASGYEGTISTTGNFDLTGPQDSFANNLGTSLDVIFGKGGLAPGGSAFFSLEEALTPGSIVVGAPEPATLSIVGAALAGFGLLRRRRKTA